MNRQQTISLRKKLVKNSVWSSVFAGCVAFILLIGISSYQTMSINDEIMDEVTDMLLTSDITMNSGQHIDELSDEFDVEYQLIFNQEVLTSSKNFPFQVDLRKYNEEGYSYILYDHQLWRTYINYEDDPNFYVISIQPIKTRFEELWQTIAIYLLVVIVLWLLQWGFVHFAIKKQFENISLLSDKISRRNATNLEPIVQTPIEIVEFRPIVSQLNHLLERLKASMLAEQRFTADASHELRSPLSAIQMRLQLLQRKYRDHLDFKNDIQQIQIDVNRNQHVLENLLLLARLDPTDANKLPKSSFNLDLTIMEVLESLQPFIEEKQIECIVKEENQYVLANPELIYTCIRNLVDNAIRYENLNGKIYISSQKINDFQEIVVEDSGDKLQDETLNHLGERFYRALGTKTKGSGLGLSICKKIVELHCGSIQFSRSAHGGLKAVIRIPQE